jgi:CHAT domain
MSVMSLDSGLLLNVVKESLGLKDPLRPRELCTGLTLPIGIFDQIYSFNRDTLIKAIPRPEKSSAKDLAPASFFIAGVSTVVGTLWPVETNASAYFFTRFYTHVNKKTSRLDAFAGAQRETRRKFSKYRDWAFYLEGDWR